MIIFDVFKYFSRFVSRKALKDFFKASTGEHYKNCMNEVLQMDDKRRDENIKFLIFGINEEAARKMISQVDGRYIFIDYSIINSSVDQLDVKTDYFHVAITVAEPHISDEDQFAQMLRQDGCLKSIAAIRRYMRHDQDLMEHIDWMSWPQKITPFAAPGLSNSYGWTMEFDIRGVDIV